MPKANVAYVYRGDASVAQVIAKDGNGDWNTYDFRVNEPVPCPPRQALSGTLTLRR